MRTPYIPLNRNLVPTSDELRPVLFTLVSQTINLGGPDEGIAEPLPILGLQGCNPPFWPQGGDFVFSAFGHAQILEELDARPWKNRSSVELMERRVW